MNALEYSVSKETLNERKKPTMNTIIAQNVINIIIPPSKDLVGHTRSPKRDGGWRGYFSNACLSRRNILRPNEQATKNAINMKRTNTVIFNCEVNRGRTPTRIQQQLPRIVRYIISLERR
jgi:hypothetical protein